MLIFRDSEIDDLHGSKGGETITSLSILLALIIYFSGF